MLSEVCPCPLLLIEIAQLTHVEGLADALRNEMLLYDIGVTMFMPAGIDSPGYIEEQKEKPAPTKKLEESDEISPPEVVVGHLIRGEFQTSTFKDVLMSIFQNSHFTSRDLPLGERANAG